MERLNCGLEPGWEASLRYAGEVCPAGGRLQDFAYDLFLSHASDDKPAVRELAGALTGVGLRVWLDEERMPPGTEPQEAIVRALQDSRHVAVWITDAWLAKSWTTWELKTFREAAGAERRVVPVLRRPWDNGKLGPYLTKPIAAPEHEHGARLWWLVWCGVRGQGPGPRDDWQTRWLELVADAGASTAAVSRLAPIARPDPLSGALKDLTDRVAALLAPPHHVAVCAFLAEQLGADASPHELARALVEAGAESMVNVLVWLDDEIRAGELRGDGRQGLAKRLLQLVLPYAVDWRESTAELKAACAAGDRHFTVPLRTETLAEIVLSCAEGRDYRFQPLAAGTYLTGVGCVRFPAAGQAAVFGSARTALEAVSQVLAGKLGVPAQGSDDLVVAVEGRLKAAAMAPPRLRERWYLVVIDEALAAAGVADAWQVALDGPGSSLKNLRMLRLTGDREQLALETLIEGLLRHTEKESP